MVPDSLALQRPEKRRNTVAFFPPPNPGDVLGFRVLLGAPNSELKVTGAVEVGTLQPPSSGMIGVCMRPDPRERLAQSAEIVAEGLGRVGRVWHPLDHPQGLPHGSRGLAGITSDVGRVGPGD